MLTAQGLRVIDVVAGSRAASLIGPLERREGLPRYGRLLALAQFERASPGVNTPTVQADRDVRDGPGDDPKLGVFRRAGH